MGLVGSVGELAGKAAFVTGAGSGIGEALARAFAARGVRVVVADIDAASVEALAADLRERGAAAVPVAYDVADRAGWDAAAQVARAAFGRIDILANNAGIGTARRALADLTDDEIDLILGVNVKGVLNGIRTFVPAMLADGVPAQVVNTGSILSHFARAGAGDYVISKYAVLALSETLRAELLGTNVSVAVLCPGLVDTSLAKNTSALRGATPAPTVTLEKPDPGVAPERIGDAVVEGIVAGRFYLFPHPEYAEILAMRTEEIRAAITSGDPAGEPERVEYLGRSVLDVHLELADQARRPPSTT